MNRELAVPEPLGGRRAAAQSTGSRPLLSVADPVGDIPGDFNRVTVEEVDRLARGDASGRVQR
jgi:hypothetical protein